MSPARAVQSSRPTFSDVPAILQELGAVLRSGRLMVGPYLARFEEAFAASVGCREAVGVSSCTAALEIVLRYVGVEGAEVVVPANTFIATANAALYAGGRPVLADVEPRSLSLDLVALREAITDKTRAVILVHLGGLISPELPAIRALCAERRLALLEDCAHAHGAAWEGASAGSFGLAGCFSFYPTKILTAAGGGMITTNDPALGEFARRVRVHGRRDAAEAVAEFGNDWFLDEVRSVLGWHQLQRLNEQWAVRSLLAEAYRSALRPLTPLAPVLPDPRCRPSWYTLIALCEDPSAGRWLREGLRERYGIEAEALYDPPVHLQPVYRARFGYREGAYPVAEALARRQVCLPLHPALSLEDVRYVTDCLAEALSEAGARSPGGAR